MNRLKIKLVAIAIICFFSVDALAQSADDIQSTIPGCDTAIKNIIRNYAESKVAYEVAVIDELLTRPRSVLNMICFKESLKKSAESSSQIFSGDFFSDIEDFIDNSMQAHLANFDDDITGTLDGDGKCVSIGEVVATQDSLLVKPIPAFEYALSDEFGSVGEMFQKSWEASKKGNIFKNLEDARDDLYSSYDSTAMIFNKMDSTCLVLEKAGLLGVSCDEE